MVLVLRGFAGLNPVLAGCFVITSVTSLLPMTVLMD